MLGRLVLVIHWGIFVWIAILLAIEFYFSGFERLADADTYVFLVPFVLFTLIYWIMKNRWAFFPWQHVKPEE
mgnify:CR=1 FL=1